MSHAGAVQLDGFSYRPAEAPRAALESISADIQGGEFVLVAGASGAGKSTLIRALAGLAPGFDGGTAAGTVTVAGLDTRDHGPAEIGRVCGTVIQDPERQVVMSTVRSEIALPLESRGQSAAEVERGVEEVALLLGIQDLLARRLSELSGGELQRVAIAAALAVRPSVLLLDEPTSQLDPVAADDLAWTLRRLNQEQGITVIVAEQRLERFLGGADRVLVLDGGRLEADASPRGFLQWAAATTPELLPPTAELFMAAGLVPLPESVKAARATLADSGITRSLPLSNQPDDDARDGGGRRRSGFGWPRLRRNAGDVTGIELTGIWDERAGGRTILAGIDLAVDPGESVALMGRNGAGKSTLLRHAAGLLEPSRGKVRAAGPIAYLSQTPGAYLPGDRLGDCLSDDLLRAADLTGLADRNPRDLSGGEAQRAALALATSSAAGDGAPAVVLLDEPTRGMDAGHRAALIGQLRLLAGAGAAVIVATHDPELAAAACERTVLMGEGVVLADSGTVEILTGGWYFTTETSRVLGGAGGALLPAEGAAMIRESARAAQTAGPR